MTPGLMHISSKWNCIKCLDLFCASKVDFNGVFLWTLQFVSNKIKMLPELHDKRKQTNLSLNINPLFPHVDFRRLPDGCQRTVAIKHFSRII